MDEGDGLDDASSLSGATFEGVGIMSKDDLMEARLREMAVE